MTVRVVLTAAVLLAVPQLALARPAVIRVFEASARAEPAADAAVVHRFPERAEVSVSEEVKDGWRRVRLPDGGTAWIEDAALALGAPVDGTPGASVPPTLSPPPFVPPPPVAAPPPPPDLRPRVVVEDPAQLPALMAKDPRFAPKAEALVQRQKTAYVVAGLGLATSIALGLASASQASSTDPRADSSGPGLLIGAAAAGLGGIVLAAVIHPRRSEVLELLTGWNGAHPDTQLALLTPAVIVPAHVVVP